MSDAEFFEKAIKEKLCLLKDILLKDESSCDPKIIFQEVFMVVFQKLYKIAYFLEYRPKKFYLPLLPYTTLKFQRFLSRIEKWGLSESIIRTFLPIQIRKYRAWI